MSLTGKQKATVKDFFSKISTRSEDIGAEALSRYGVYFLADEHLRGLYPSCGGLHVPPSKLAKY